ncbi:aminoglycoside phosphotransferase family protein [Lederbergia panacisoli]|uniref:aminoglycoside phosphotransferase family protein n=1 Tax=Lederbergia panacisoli TaxID=1255251 RepID=UPI00214C0319|nr:aminoglycoside phosphotransferase family protein [Lederbergia panacisoli]MCR2820525.1 aminoglycoside phosphotransferase family protein [Lederbergia panacisoli]
MNNQFYKDRDGLNDRLLLFMKKKSGLPFTQIKQIKHGVWLLPSINENWVLKEYLSTFKLSVQIDFTKELKNSGFMKTYSFFPHIFQMDGRIFGLMQYIDSGNFGSFHYDHDENIQSALELLTNFHQSTGMFVDAFKEQLPYFQQRSKWEKRLIDYYTFINLHKFKPLYSHLNRLAQYGVWALQQMNEHVSYFVKKPHCIIHGDVASHNFIKSKDGILCMIDFDLISIAPSHIDLLQFCNRILPSLDWDADRLFSYKLLNNLKSVRPFLAALVYPTDIFREWIFFSTSDVEQQSKKWSYVQRLTFHKYKERLAFYEKIKEKVENWK